MERRHDLDWLRVGAVLLLLPFHSARVFDPFEDFYVHGATSEPLFWSVIASISMWQMELLFVLAGAASWFAFGRRSAHEYRAERVKRLLVPFLFGLVVIIPIQSYLAIAWREQTPSIPTFSADYWTFGSGEVGGYDGGFTPGHLWFILYLFLYSLAAAPLFSRWHADPGPRRWVRWYLIGMPLVMWVGEAIPNPEDGPQNLFYSFALFVGGFLLMSEPRVESAIDGAWRWLSALAAVGIASRLWLGVSGTYAAWDEGVTSVVLDLYRFSVTWIVVLALLALGSRFLSFETPFLRWANEGAYPIYLLHQSVIVVVAYAVLSWRDLAAVPGWLVVMVVSLLATVGVYEWLVRPWNPVRFLFGMKPRRAHADRPAPVSVTTSRGAA